jgi:CBS domain-containing protein
MDIARLYTRGVITVPQSTTLKAAAELMRERHVGCLVITESPPLDDRAIGIVTDRDLVVQGVAAGAHPTEATIAEVMTPNIARIAHDADAHQALGKMAALGVRRLAVTGANGTIVGVLSFDDLVDGLAVEVSDLARIIHQERTREAQPAFRVAGTARAF